MTRKLLFLSCAIVMMCVGRVSAQSESPVWYAVADNEVYIPISDISYMLFVDDSQEFSIIKSNGNVVASVSEVTFLDRLPEAVEDVTTERALISVFPNPVVNQLTLQGLRENAQVRVLALDGAMLMEAQATQGTCNIDVTSLSAGIYLLQVNGTTVKFIKK